MSQRCRRTSRQPSARSHAEALGDRPHVRGDPHRGDEDALKRNLPASTAKTQPGPATAMSRPERLGPKIRVPLCEIATSAFACCSRSALTVWGIRAVEAG